LALIPITLLYQQNQLLSSQNERFDIQNNLITKQNKRLDQQTYLQEAERRSSLVFLFSNVMDAVDSELKDDKNTNRSLSPQLIGRIAGLSTRLKPYQYLDGDTLINKPLSPERGQLLISLLGSELDTATLKKIYEKANFSYSDLKYADLNSSYLKGINLSKSDLSHAILDGANLQKANLKESYLGNIEPYTGDTLSEGVIFFRTVYGTSLIGTDLRSVNLRDANIVHADLGAADMRHADLTGSNLGNANLHYADMRYTRLASINVKKANLNNVKTEMEFSKKVPNYRVENKNIMAEYIEEKYVADSLFEENNWIYILKHRTPKIDPF